jgi:hypothetical protein
MSNKTEVLKNVGFTIGAITGPIGLGFGVKAFKSSRDNADRLDKLEQNSNGDVQFKTVRTTLVDGLESFDTSDAQFEDRAVNTKSMNTAIAAAVSGTTPVDITDLQNKTQNIQLTGTAPDTTVFSGTITCAEPTSGFNAANKKYVDDQLTLQNAYDNSNGSIDLVPEKPLKFISGNSTVFSVLSDQTINANNNIIKNVGNPLAASDASTKEYVDQRLTFIPPIPFAANVSSTNLSALQLYGLSTSVFLDPGGIIGEPWGTYTSPLFDTRIDHVLVEVETVVNQVKINIKANDLAISFFGINSAGRYNVPGNSNIISPSQPIYVTVENTNTLNPAGLVRVCIFLVPN